MSALRSRRATLALAFIALAVVVAFVVALTRGEAIAEHARISGRQGTDAVALPDGDLLMPVVREDCVLTIVRISRDGGRIEKRATVGKDAFDGWCPDDVEHFSARGEGFGLVGGVTKVSGLFDKERLDRGMAMRLDVRGAISDDGIRTFRRGTSPSAVLASGALVHADGLIVSRDGSARRRLAGWSPGPDPILEPTLAGGVTLVGGDDSTAIDVRRLRPDGRRDVAFGDGGSSRLKARGQPFEVVNRRDGGVLVSYLRPSSDAFAASRVRLIALFDDGRLDRRFGRGGGVDIGDSSFAEAPNGGIVAVGLAENHDAVLATSYDARGRPLARATRTLPEQLFPVDDLEAVSSSVVVGPRGEVTAIFSEARSARLGIVRLQPDLRLDRSFGRRGVIVLARV